MRKAAVVQFEQQTETDLHRVILFASNGAEVLVRHDHARLGLPDVPIPRHQRVAENLTAFMRREWSEDAVSLFGLSPSITECERRYQVTESTAAQRSIIAGFRWVSVSSLQESEFEEPADYKAIASALAQCEEYAAGRGHGPFGRLGWSAELTEWVRDRIRPAGLTLNGRFTQLNACPTFSLIRFETNGPAIWFKAVGEPNLREYPITLALAQYFPAFVPRIIAAREDWNGWLADEAEGTHPTEDSDLGVWARVATTLAGFQIASVGQTLHLLGTGCRDARVCSLLERVEPFLEVMAELMERQTKESPPPLSRIELLALRTQLQDILSEARNSEIPNAIGHLDFNPGNIVENHEHCVFLDWAEACAGHPFLTLQYLLERLRRHRQPDNSWETAITSAYLNNWRSFVSPDEITKSLSLSPLVAAFAYAACRDAWRDPARANRPEVARHLRSLTRRVKRETELLVSDETRRSVACLS
jgi:Phosphotransferase enzyme family